MKKKILLIYNGYALIEQTKYKINRLVNEIELLGYSSEVISSTSILTSNKIDKSFFKNYLFAIDLDKDYYLSKLISNYINIYNNPESMSICDDKMTTILYLEKYNILTPKTISAPLCYLDSIDVENNSFLDLLEKEFIYPFVFKLNHGSLGKQVKLINSKKELKETYKKYFNQAHLYEEFLSLHKGSDYRVIVINNEVVAVMNRINKKDFRSNIYLGGKGIDVTSSVDNKIKDIALEATKVLNLTYSGVDVMLDNNSNPCIIEVNSNPFFSEVEKVTNINISRKLISYLIDINKQS